LRLVYVAYTAALLAGRLIWPDLWLFGQLPVLVFAALLFLSILPFFWPADRYDQFARGRVFYLPGVAIALIALAAGCLLWTFRLRLFLPPPEGAGDSLHLIEHIPVYTQLFGFLDSFDEPLELFLRSRIYLLFNDAGIGVDLAYAIISTIAGSIYTAGLLFFLRGKDLRSALLALPILLLTPLLALFAGYVESYTLVTLTLTALLALTAHCAGKAPSSAELMMLGGLAALSFLLHGITAFALPALIFLTFEKSSKVQDFWKNASAGGLAAAAFLLPAYAFFFLVVEYPISISESFALRPPILSPLQWFEAEIVLGKLQSLIGAAPLLVPSLPLVAQRIWHWREMSASIRILFIAWACYMVHFLVWNPIIGFPADRDLFSLFAISANFLLWYLYRESRQSWTTHLPLFTALQLTFALAWILHNAEPAPGRDLRDLAMQRAEHFISRTANDPFFKQLPATQRRTWVKARLFADRMHEEAAGCVHLPQLDEQMKALGQALSEANARATHTVWQELTRINVAIQADCRPAAAPHDAR